jgi:hypothetical protein
MSLKMRALRRECHNNAGDSLGHWNKFKTLLLLLDYFKPNGTHPRSRRIHARTASTRHTGHLELRFNHSSTHEEWKK